MSTNMTAQRPPTTHALDFHGISKAYHGITVVDDVSSSVEEGEIFVILGPNGVGKAAVRIADAA